MKSIAKFHQDACTTDQDTTPENRKQFNIKWRDFTFTEKTKFIHDELHSVIVTLIHKKSLNEQKLSMILDLKVTLNEAMRLKLTNTYSYIMYLIRKYTTNTARSVLNQLTEQINKYEDLLHKNIEKEVKRYRKLNKDNQEQQSSESTPVETHRDKIKKQKSKAKQRQRQDKDSVLLKQTYISGGRLIKKEEIICVQPDSAFTPFTRITKELKDNK